MLRQLLSILRGDSPLGEMRQDFSRMLELTGDMTRAAGDLFFETRKAPEARERIYEHDREVNEYQRSIRKRIVAHLAIPGNASDAPYCLALMSLVKDVERLGDYAKNLAELLDIRAEPIPNDERTVELRAIRQAVETTFQALGQIWTDGDRARAFSFITEGRNDAKRCEALVRAVSTSNYDANVTTVVVLAARYYKRIGGHLLNVLSAVVMPLHKLDYYDEQEQRP